MAKGYKTGGRKKGTPNKVSGTVREMISQSISTELESLPILLNQLEPKEKMDAIIKLLAYLIPKNPTEENEQNETWTSKLQRIYKHIEKTKAEKKMTEEKSITPKGSLVKIFPGNREKEAANS